MDDKNLTREEAISRLNSYTKNAAQVVAANKQKQGVEAAQEALNKYNGTQLASTTRDWQDDALGLTDANILTGNKSGLVAVQAQAGKESIDRALANLKEQLSNKQALAGSYNTSSNMAQLEFISYLQQNGSDIDKDILKIEELSLKYGSLTEDDLSKLFDIQQNYSELKRNDSLDPDNQDSAGSYLSGIKLIANNRIEYSEKYKKEIEQLEQNIANLEASKKKNNEVIRNVSVYPEDEEGIKAGPPFMKMITDKSPELEKVQLADFSDELKDGYIGAKNGTFLKYLENPNFYTNSAGRIFVDSSNSHEVLAKLNDDPQKQKEYVQTAQDILGDTSKSYEIDPNNPKFKSPNDKVLTLGNRKFGLPSDAPYTDNEKKVLSEWEDQHGLITSQSKPDAAENKVDVKPPEEKVKEEPIVPDDYTQKDDLQVANHKDIPYFRVNGYNKIRFPNTWRDSPYHIDIMGLPPMRVHKEQTVPLVSKNAFDLVTTSPLELVPEMYMYDEDEQLKKSFLKLTIHPIDIEFLYGANGELRTEEERTKMQNSEKYNNRSMVIEEVTYNFAVQAKNNVSFNHSNQYQASGFESTLGNAFSSIGNAFSEFSALSNVGGGAGSGTKGAFNALAGFGNRAGSVAQQAIRESMDTLQKTINSSFTDENDKLAADQIVGALGKFGELTIGKLSGSRIDLPDIWTSSQTNISHQFTIELMTMNPDPLSIQYCKDILLPLYILMTLAMPADVDGILYKTPPYIYCSLDEFIKIKLGAITNISIDPHIERVNFKRAPTHVTVQLTIRDLYSVMKQKTYDKSNKVIGEENGDTTDKDEFIHNFVKYAEYNHAGKEPTTNEAYYLTEFSRIPAYMAALENYKQEQAAKREEQQQAASENAQAGAKQDTKSVSADTSKTAQAAKEGADKNVQLAKDGKKTNFITSIGNAITGVTKGIKNVVAGVNNAIAPVRNLINTGKLVMNSVNGLKSSIKLIGQTANLEGILNGQFASSVGFAFSNIANATDVATAISNSCVGGNSLKTILNNLGNVPQQILTNNIANCISDNGNVTLSNQIRDAAASMYGMANMFGSIYPNITGLKNLNSRGSDIASQLSVLFDNLGGIGNGINSLATGYSVGSTSASNVVSNPLLSAYVSSLTKAMVNKGMITANEAASNTNTQEKIQETAQTAINQMTLPVKVVYDSDGNASLESTTNFKSNISYTLKDGSIKTTSDDGWKGLVR